MNDGYQTPSQRSETPEDWFISRDGRQYSDEPHLTDEQRDEIINTVPLGPQDDGWSEAVEEALEDAMAKAKQAAIVRRRHAKDACFVDCYFRLMCLDIALRDRPMHGTWGGYYEEELQVLYDKIDEREKKEG